MEGKSDYQDTAFRLVAPSGDFVKNDLFDLFALLLSFYRPHLVLVGKYSDI